MNELGRLILGNTAWLYTRLYEGRLIFLDLWSLAHLWSGFAVMTVLLAARARRRWLLLTAALLAYELVELAFIWAAFHAFHPETLKDQGTDVAVGLLGGALSVGLWTLWRRLSVAGRERLLRHVTAGLVAVTIAFEWVGAYGYRYDHPALNSAGLCWWAMLLWTLALVLVAEAFASFEPLLGRALLAAVPTAGGYFLALFLVEYVGYVTLGIHEVGHPGRQALALDLVHGTTALHVFYVSAPFLCCLLFVGARALFRRAFGWEPAPPGELADARVVSIRSS
jgi:hypothetical protein